MRAASTWWHERASENWNWFRQLDSVIMDKCFVKTGRQCIFQETYMRIFKPLCICVCVHITYMLAHCLAFGKQSNHIFSPLLVEYDDNKKLASFKFWQYRVCVTRSARAVYQYKITNLIKFRWTISFLPTNYIFLNCLRFIIRWHFLRNLFGLELIVCGRMDASEQHKICSAKHDHFFIQTTQIQSANVRNFLYLLSVFFMQCLTDHLTGSSEPIHRDYFFLCVIVRASGIVYLTLNINFICFQSIGQWLKLKYRHAMPRHTLEQRDCEICNKCQMHVNADYAFGGYEKGIFDSEMKLNK